MAKGQIAWWCRRSVRLLQSSCAKDYCKESKLLLLSFNEHFS